MQPDSRNLDMLHRRQSRRIASGERRNRPARRQEHGTYDEYERRKQEWRAFHPEATSAEYTKAMRRIALELGL